MGRLLGYAYLLGVQWQAAALEALRAALIATAACLAAAAAANLGTAEIAADFRGVLGLATPPAAAAAAAVTAAGVRANAAPFWPVRLADERVNHRSQGMF